MTDPGGQCRVGDLVSHIWSLKLNRHPHRRYIHPVEAIILGCHIIAYSYCRLHFSPLLPAQAIKCLKSLVVGVKRALQDLHSTRYAHNDIRLPNICFDSSYEPVLIDLDYCYPIHKQHLIFKASGINSCMYTCQLPGGQTDYVQLGWLVAWILDSSGDYHEHEWSSLK